MTEEELELVRFPIGRLAQAPYSTEERQRRQNEIRDLPRLLESAVEGLTAEDLQQPFRAGGWTLNQVVHHLADSHMHAFLRFKMALTADQPTVAAYDQDLFVHTADVTAVPVNISITLLHSLHARWHELVSGLDQEALMRTFIHPERPAPVVLWGQLGLYAWHGRHHSMHIIRWRERNQR